MLPVDNSRILGPQNESNPVTRVHSQITGQLRNIAHHGLYLFSMLCKHKNMGHYLHDELSPKLLLKLGVRRVYYGEPGNCAHYADDTWTSVKVQSEWATCFHPIHKCISVNWKGEKKKTHSLTHLEGKAIDRNAPRFGEQPK